MPFQVDSAGYFARHEMSNSDLTALLNSYTPKQNVFLFGSIVDAIITGNPMPEDTRGVDWVDVCGAVTSFLSDPLNKFIWGDFDRQVAFVSDISFVFGGIEYTIPARCLCDFYSAEKGIVADLKTTACKTDKDWQKSVIDYSYHRQAAWYLDITGANVFHLRAVSKTAPHELFSTAIERGSRLYNLGKEAYTKILSTII